MAQKPKTTLENKKEKASLLLDSLKFLVDAVGGEDTNTLPDTVVVQSPKPKELPKSKHEQKEVDVTLRDSTDTVIAGTDKFKGHFDSTKEAKEFKASAFGRNLSKIYSSEVGQICPHCKYGRFEEVISFSGKVCEFFVYCENCNAYVCTYQPMGHQEAFHKDEHLKKLYAGGFGSAKTYTCGMEFLTTVLQIPNSAGLVGASTWGQVSDTCLKFLLDNIPVKLIMKSNQDKVSWYIDLINGSRISAKALDNEGKIRSANLSAIWVEEASEVDFAVVKFIEARLRNKCAFFKGKNRLKMLLSSNPDVGWLNSDWLMCSDVIYYHGDVPERYTVNESKRDKFMSTHIAATSSNIYLPADYEENLAKNKPPWWVNRFLKGSFAYTEGLVYPNFSEWFVEPFEIPAHWRRVTGTDFGRRDATAHVVGALDPVKKIIYVYNCIEEPLDDKGVEHFVKLFKEVNTYPDYLLAFPHKCDPRGRNRDQVSGQSWIDTYYKFGITFSPADNCEANSLAPTIEKLNSYARNGRIKFFRSCKPIWDSFSKYKYKPRKMGEDKNQGETPQDSNNHIPDSIRYLLSPFPDFPKDDSEFDFVWRSIMVQVERRYNPLATYETHDKNFNYVTDFTDNFG